MKVLLLIDKLHWSYHSITNALMEYNQDSDLDLSMLPIKKNEKQIKKVYKKYDLFFILGFQTYERINFLPKKNTLVGIHSHHSWDERRTTPEKDVNPPSRLIDFLNEFLRVNTVSNRLYNLFKTNGVSKIFYTPNGVDTSLFFPEPIKHKGFVVGYSGSVAHDWRKGTSKYILPAAEVANVKVKLAMLSTGDYVSQDNMPKFYNALDVYVCASSSEGFSLSVLEAAGCGLPIVSTKVGGCVDLIEDGRNGFLVKREVGAIAEKIMMLKNDRALCEKISFNICDDIKKKWCWSKRAKDWVGFITS